METVPIASSDEQPEIILASASPRRRLLFNLLGIPHRVLPAGIDERAIDAVSPREFALKAAFAKAGALDEMVPQGSLVVAADTIVVYDQKIFFKPVDEIEAREMLASLSGETHQVITGIAVREVGKATQLDAATTDVKIKSLSAKEIADYVATGEPLDKAGSYGIQGLGGQLVERVSGDYFNVVGLPINNLLSMLGVHVETGEWLSKHEDLTREKFDSLV